LLAAVAGFMVLAHVGQDISCDLLQTRCARPDSRPPRLRIGFVPGVTLTKWRRIWADRMHRVPLDVVEVAQAGQRGALVSGAVDMCFVRLPIDTEGLHTIPLYEEVPVVVAPKDHPLAAFDDVSLADLAGETFVADDDEATGIDRVAWGAGLMIRAPLRRPDAQPT